jgi:hypothetical protein
LITAEFHTGFSLPPSTKCRCISDGASFYSPGSSSKSNERSAEDKYLTDQAQGFAARDL